jgi:hypothetical protein
MKKKRKAPAKKRAPKKKPKKKKTKKRKTPKRLEKETHPTKYFILCNGKPLKNIKELADIMEDIEDHVFNHHVTEDRNDFATWVKDVFKEIELAKKIAGVKDKKHIQLVIYKHISHKLW